MLVREGIESLLDAFNSEYGVNEQGYIGARNMIHHFLGLLPANDFVGWINATDGQFYWREGTSSGTFIEKWHKELERLDETYPTQIGIGPR